MRLEIIRECVTKCVNFIHLVLDGKGDLLGLLAKINEDKLGIEGMIQLRTAKEALKEYFKVRDTSTQSDL